jgi:outer membrane protein assembly factor BamB
MCRGITCSLVVLGSIALGAGGCGGGGGCPPGYSPCDGICANTVQDRNHCGACDNRCLPGQFCTAGTCVPCQNECMLGQKRCTPGTSLEFQTCGDPDADTCLAWVPDGSCAPGQVCSGGDCVTGCEDECSREGATTCAPAPQNGLLTCGDHDDDPCLEWGGYQGCPAGQSCSAGLCVAGCQDECGPLNQQRCAAPPANGLETCGNFDADSCLEWGGFQACPGGQTCSGGACSSSCQDDCQGTARVCDGNGFKVCGYFDADPCLDWSGVTACGAHQICQDGRCVLACSDQCPAPETRRCSGSGADEGWDRCYDWNGDGCLEWGGHTNCGVGNRCENGACVDACTPDCSVQGVQVCHGTGYRVCGQYDADACLDWSSDIPCGAGETCSNGVCSATCTDECAVGQRQCYGTGWRECGEANDGDPCRDWLAVHPCAAWETCPAASPGCVTTCSDECPSQGAVGCSPDLTGTRTCSAGHDPDPCLEWGPVTLCPSGRVCSPSPAPAQCVLACADACQPVNSRRCTSDGLGFEICSDWNSDGCLEWGGATSCGAGQTCSGGQCAASCTDDCSPSGALVCDTGDPTGKGYRICGQFDADACLDLGSPAACGYGQRCQTGSCVTVCTDGCATPGEVRCSGNVIEVCAAGHDADECLEWGTQATCGSGSLCWRGGCVPQNPPATVLVNEILVDDAGTDGEQVFIELWGPGGLSLTGYYLLAINGAGGGEISRIYLDGYSLPTDGHFVVVHPSAEPALMAVADLVSSHADLQNGPDNLQVKWAGGQVVDALGYGAFEASHVFAGEGAGPQDAAGLPAYSATFGAFCLSRSSDHADTDVNRLDFFQRTSCSPGWEGPGKVLWQLQVYGGTSTPALDTAGNLYTVDSWGDLFKASPAGERLYNPSFDFTSSVALSSDETTLYVGSNAGVYALNAATGVTRSGWPVETSRAVYSTPALDAAGNLYFGSRNGGLYSYSSAGALRWRYGPAGCAAGSCPAIDSSPAVAPGRGPGGVDLVVVGVGGTGQGALAAVNAASGAEVWRVTQPTGPCQSSPALGPDGTVYAGCDDGTLYALAPTTGASRPGFPVNVAPDAVSLREVRGSSPTVLVPSYGGVEIYMTSRADRSNAFIFGADGSVLWSADLFEGNSSFSLAENGAFYLHSAVPASGYGYLIGYSAAGTLEWYTLLEDSSVDWISSSPAISASGVVYVVAHRGPLGTGYLYAVQGVSGLNTTAGSYPKFHGDRRNSGRGY